MRRANIYSSTPSSHLNSFVVLLYSCQILSPVLPTLNRPEHPTSVLLICRRTVSLLQVQNKAFGIFRNPTPMLHCHLLERLELYVFLCSIKDLMYWFSIKFYDDHTLSCAACLLWFKLKKYFLFSGKWWLFLYTHSLGLAANILFIVEWNKIWNTLWI